MKASHFIFFGSLAGSIFFKNKTAKTISTIAAFASGSYNLIDLWSKHENDISLEGIRKEPIPEDKYKLRYSKHFLVFDFISFGPKGDIIKKVIYKCKEQNIFALSMGDFNPLTNTVDYNVISDNNDMLKVLSTVAKTVELFFEKHPKAILFAEGTTNARNRLYQIQITKAYSIIKDKYIIYGLLNNMIEPYQPDKKYSGFLIRKK